MEQVKHPNVFIYYTKYKFFKAKLNKKFNNQKNKKIKLLIHQNDLITSQILAILFIKDSR